MNNMFHDWLKTLNVHLADKEDSHFDARGTLETLTAGLAPLKALTVLQMEMIRWSSRRAQALLSIPQRLSGCKTQQDIFQEQKRFWEAACAHNQETMEKMVQVWTDLLGFPSLNEGPNIESKSSQSQSLIKFPSKSHGQEGQKPMNTSPSSRPVYSS